MQFETAWREVGRRRTRPRYSLRLVARLAHLPLEATGLKARRSLTIEEANRFVDAVGAAKTKPLCSWP